MNRTLLILMLISGLALAGPVIPGLELDSAIHADILASSRLLDLLLEAGCTLCDDLSECVQGDIMLSPNPTAFELEAIFYNGTVSRTPIVNAPLIVYVRNETMGEIYKTYTDNRGVAGFSFAQWSGSCHDYMVFHCKDQHGCDFTTCVDAVGIDRTGLGISSIDDLPLAPGGTPSGGAQDPLNVLPVYASYRYCPPPPPLGDTMPVFCLPLILILMFLLGSMFLAGRNPFIFFDFSSPRMGKYIRYTARGRGFGLDMMSMASAATTTVSIAKNPKAMLAKSKADMKSGRGMMGGVAAGVAGGVTTVRGASGTLKAAGDKFWWKKGSVSGAASAVWDTVKGKARGTAIGQIVSTTKKGWEGGSAAGLKALGLALAQYSSFGQLVQAVQTAALVWAVASSIPAARSGLEVWGGTTRVECADGSRKEIEGSFDKQTGAIVWRAYDVDENGARIPQSIRTFDSYDGLVSSIGPTPKSLESLASVRVEGYNQVARYARTVLFFAPLEIANRKSDFADIVTKNLKGAGKDVSFAYTDPATGAQLKLSAGELRTIARSESGAGMLAVITGADGTRTTQLVSQKTFNEMQANLPQGASKVEAGGSVDLTRIISGIDPGSREAKRFGIPGMTTEATQINSMGQMVAASAMIYKTALEVVANQPAHFNALRTDLSDNIKNLSPEGLASSVTIGGETKSVADWLKAGKMDSVVSTLASDPSQAPPALSGLAGSAQALYGGEARQMSNFSSIFTNTSKFAEMVSSDKEKVGTIAWKLEGLDLLRAQTHARLVTTQLTTVSQGRALDVGLLDGMDFKGAQIPSPPSVVNMARAGTAAVLEMNQDAIQAFKEKKAELEKIENPSMEQDRMLKICGLVVDAAGQHQRTAGIADPAERARAQEEVIAKAMGYLPQLGQYPVGQISKERDALIYQNQALSVFEQALRTPPTAEGGHLVERAIYGTMYDMSRNPEQALKTMGVLQTLVETKDNPARLNSMAQGFQDYLQADRPELRDAAYNRLQVQDATTRFGDTARADAIGGHPDAETALSAAINRERQRLDQAASGMAPDARAAVRARFDEVKSAEASYRAAEAQAEQAKSQYDEARRIGSADREFQTYNDATETAARQKESYLRSATALVGPETADQIINRTFAPGSLERLTADKVKEFEQRAASAPDMNAANRILTEVAEASGRGTDPFISLRERPREGETPAPGTANLPLRTSMGVSSPPSPEFDYNRLVPPVHNEVFHGAVGAGVVSLDDLYKRGLFGRQ